MIYLREDMELSRQSSGGVFVETFQFGASEKIGEKCPDVFMKLWGLHYWAEKRPSRAERRGPWKDVKKRHENIDSLTKF